MGPCDDLARTRRLDCPLRPQAAAMTQFASAPIEPDVALVAGALFGWPLRDPLPAHYHRVGRSALWLNGPASNTRTRGGTTPLLLIPGAHHGAWCYGGYLDAFEALGTAVAALDLPGHGALVHEGLAPETGITEYVDEACAAALWLAERHGRPPVILGHSLGGLVAAATAARGPASGLLLLAPSPPGNLPGAAPVPVVPIDQLRAPPGDPEVHARFLGGLTVPDLRAWATRLCPESPTAMNDRYTLRIPVDFGAIRGLPGLCIEAGIEDAARHPPGQDAAIARAYGIGYQLLPQAPHCMMAGPSGLESFNLLRQWWLDTGF